MLIFQQRRTLWELWKKAATWCPQYTIIAASTAQKSDINIQLKSYTHRIPAWTLKTSHHSVLCTTHAHMINLLFHACRKYHTLSGKHCTCVCGTHAICALTTHDISLYAWNNYYSCAYSSYLIFVHEIFLAQNICDLR